MNKASTKLQKLSIENKNFLAYHQFTPIARKSTVTKPSVIFMGGFMSNMDGTKALFLEKWCKSNKVGFTRFDYYGHGKSSGEFIDGTIGMWVDNILAIIDNITKGPLILVGSSLGGWLMLHAALKRPKRIRGLIGIAPGIDFTENLIWDVLSKKEQNTLSKEGIYVLPSKNCSDPNSKPFPISYKLIKEARKHLLLKKKEINISCSVSLIHGMKDIDVPYGISLALAEKIKSDNVNIALIKKGDHKMSDIKTLNTITGAVAHLLNDKLV